MSGVQGESVDQRVEVGRWMLSDDARAATSADLRRHGLPAGTAQVDDVLGAVTERLLVRLGQGALDLRNGTTVAAYARRSIANEVIDLFRGSHAVSLDELIEAGINPYAASEAVDETGDAAVVILDGPTPALVEDLRRALHADLARRHTQAWTIAAALVVVSLSDPDLCPAADIARPDPRHGGAGRPDRWAGLAYAGQHRCFEQPETGAVRERRRRALGHIDAALVRAHTLATAGATP